MATLPQFAQHAEITHQHEKYHVVERESGRWMHACQRLLEVVRLLVTSHADSANSSSALAAADVVGAARQ